MYVLNFSRMKENNGKYKVTWNGMCFRDYAIKQMI